MGYESRLHFRDSFPESFAADGMAYTGPIVEFEACCLRGDGPLGKLIRRCTREEKQRIEAVGSRYFVYDGEERCFEDVYGDPFTPIPLSELIAALRDERDDYRRIPLLLAIAEAFEGQIEEGQWPFGIVVLHEGH